MFGVVPKALWNRVYPSDESNLTVLALRSILVEDNGKLILIDNGWGDKQDKKFFRHVYLHGGEGLIGGLLHRGYKPENITDVVLTHLHADHCGGGVLKRNNGIGFDLTFPNATYYVSRTQWEWAANNNVREADSFLEENILPMMQSGHLKLVDEEGVLFRNISVRFYYGHTPGLMIPFINFKEKTYVFAGDLIPTTAHIPLVWNMSYDVDPLRTIREKEGLLKEALDDDYILLFQHDEHTECCTLETSAKGIRAKKKFKFSDII